MENKKKSKINDKLASRFIGSKLTIYDKEKVTEKLQAHYTISELVKIYGVSRDTILRAIDEEKVKLHKIRRTILIPAKEIPKIIKDV